ncbi:MAG: hypothetical protein A2Y12_04790 [Planctomycetes bacterium GWF2_42_9]|nr:MAG: hypothetical protein A2Y12_04790 [Planctomycetes bacterium GWF2_42_9]
MATLILERSIKINSLLSLVKDPNLIYMPSDRAVIKPKRLWNGKDLSTLQSGSGGIPFASTILPGIGCIEYHNSEHWLENRYLFDVGFGFNLYDEQNNCIVMSFDSSSHLFTPFCMHSEFTFNDGCNRLIQNVTAIDDIFVCRFNLAKPGKYHVVTFTGRPWLRFRSERMENKVLFKIIDGAYKNTNIALHASFAPEAKRAVCTQGTVLSCQFHDEYDGLSAYLIIGIDDNYERLIQRMDNSVSNPNALFIRSRLQWEKFFEESVPDVSQMDKLWKQNLAWTSFYFKSNLICHDENGVIPWHSVGCGKGSFTGCPLENTQYHIIGELHLKDHSMVFNEIRSRDKDHPTMSLTQSSTWAHQLFNSYVHRLVYIKTGNQEMMQKGLVAIEESIDKVLENRDKGDGLFWVGCHLHTPMGFDNSSRWDRAFSPNTPFEWDSLNPLLPFGIKAVEASSFLFDALQTVAFFRRELGDTQTATRWQNTALQIAQSIRGKHWSPKYRFFVDLVGEEDTPSDILSLAGTAPLWAGIATIEQAEYVAQAIADPLFFRGKYGPTSHAKNSPAYCDYWRGDVCLRLNWLAYHGLRRYGYDKLASWILSASMQRSQDHHFDGAEMWNPDTGVGYWTQSSEMGLLVDMMMTEANRGHVLSDSPKIKISKKSFPESISTGK